MSDWLTHLGNFLSRKKPFVIATVTSYHGSSPDLPGACVFIAEDKTVSLISSDNRRKIIEESARSVLENKSPYLIEKIPLGQVAAEDNGHCEVIYEYFAASTYPSWLQQLIENRDKKITSYLLREFPKQAENAQAPDISTRIVIHAREHPAVDTLIKNNDACQLIYNDTLLLIRKLSNNNILLAIAGSHPVASKIVKLTDQLPFALTHIHTSDCSDENLSLLADGYHVVVMTGDHELDFTCCKTLLHRDGIAFVGCIGSDRKAQLFKQRLIAQEVPPERYLKLHMPIGLKAVNGKQTSVVAMSILSQILSLNP